MSVLTAKAYEWSWGLSKVLEFGAHANRAVVRLFSCPAGTLFFRGPELRALHRLSWREFEGEGEPAGIGSNHLS